MLSDKQLHEIKKILKDRFYTLREEIRQKLLESNEHSYIELAGKVHDIEEESVADVLVDLQFANIDRYIEQIREIDAALTSIAERSYGLCVDCGTDIDFQRLSIQPTAKRCQTCQTRHEKIFAHTRQASL